MAHFNCAVIGDWHLAFVTAGVLSQFHKALLVHPKGGWANFPSVPVHEPGLADIMRDSQKSGRLDFTNGVSDAWSADIVWLAIDTPVNEQDEPDLAPLWDVIERVAKTQKSLKAFVVSSQVPVGFGRQVQERFHLPVAYVPENLRLGKGIETFQRADRTVIGASTPATADTVRDFLKSLDTEFLLCDLETAELIKHATNIFLATSISFAGEIARLAEATGANCDLVAKGLKMDRRIGFGAYVAPGLGFAGGTLPRDIRVLQRVGRKQGLDTPLLDAVMAVNARTTEVIVEGLLKWRSPLKNVLVMGYTYKADTDTLRRSLTLEIAERLKAKGVRVWGYDPFMNGKDLSALSGLIEHVDDLDELKTAPDAIAVLTARPAFRETPWSSLARKWRPLPLVYDTQNVVNPKLTEFGFAFKKLWHPVSEAN